MKEIRIINNPDLNENLMKLREFYKEKTNSKTISRAIRDMCNVLGIK